MICQCVLAIRPAQLTALRNLIDNPTTQQHNNIVRMLLDFRQEIFSDGSYFNDITTTGPYTVRNQLIEYDDITDLLAYAGNNIQVLYVGNVWGGPLGVEFTYDEAGDRVYSGTAVWTPSDDFAALHEALPKSRTLYDSEGNPIGTEAYPEWRLPLHPAGWTNLDVPAWEYAGVTPVAWS